MTCQPQEFSADELATEEWRVIPGFPDYDASTLGRIRSRKRSCARVLRPHARRAAAVNLKKGGKAKTVEVHLLVLEAFAGARPIGARAARADGDQLNNRLSNLSWVSRSNTQHVEFCEEDLRRESWRALSGYDGAYEVSDLGRVRSCKYAHSDLLAQGLGHCGYPTVNLSYLGKHRTMKVHHLVLNAFVGPRPDGTEACHANGVRADARLVNLRWDTHSANMADMDTHGRMQRGDTHWARKRPAKVLRGEGVGNSKLTHAQVIEILGSTLTQLALAERYGVSQTLISSIRLGKSWKHVKSGEQP